MQVYNPALLISAGDVSEGACQTNVLVCVASWNPAATFTIGADTYEWVNTTPPVPSDPTYIALYRGVAAPPATHRLRAIDAINNVTDAVNITYPAGGHAESFIAQSVGAAILIASADAPGGTRVGSSTSVACTSSALLNTWASANTYGGEDANSTDSIATSLGVEVEAGHLSQGALRIALPIAPTNYAVRNRSRSQNEALTCTGNVLTLALAGGVDPNNQLGDLLDFIAVLR